MVEPCRHLRMRKGRKVNAEKEGWLQDVICRDCGWRYAIRPEPPKRKEPR